MIEAPSKFKQKKETYAESEERDRLEALNHFETVQMDVFLKEGDSR